MGISKIKPLTSQYHSVGGRRGRGLLCLAPQLVNTIFDARETRLIVRKSTHSCAPLFSSIGIIMDSKKSSGHSLRMYISLHISNSSLFPAEPALAMTKKSGVSHSQTLSVSSGQVWHKHWMAVVPCFHFTCYQLMQKSAIRNRPKIILRLPY